VAIESQLISPSFAIRRGVGRDRIFAEPQLYEPHDTAELIRKQSRQRFGRSRGVIERQRQMKFD